MPNKFTMKVAFVFPPMWAPHSDGSLQIWNREVTTRLTQRCEVLVYTGIFDHKSNESINGVEYRRFSTLLDSRLIRGLRKIHQASKIRRPLFATDIWYLSYALKVALDLRKQSCDLAHIYNYPQFAAIIKWVNPSLRIVLNMHGEWLTQVPFTRLSKRLRRIDLILSCSGLVTRSICSKFPEVADRCRTVPMGVLADAFSKINSDRHSPESNRRRLLYVGRISPEKGVHVLLDAFQLIIQKYHDASLEIVGPEWVAPRENIVNLSLDDSFASTLSQFYEGSYQSQLLARLQPDTAKRVTFAGLVAHRDVPKYYASADCYVSPAFYESFGMSIIEAMAAGIPVVATSVGAVPELISNNETGLLVQRNNASEIADAVCRFFANSELRRKISSSAREFVRQQFSWDKICSTLFSMYQDLSENKTGSTGPTLCAPSEAC